MTSTPRNLLDYRLIIVTGKGGVGKTTVACALAEAARQAGRRVALAETSPIESVAGHFESNPALLGYSGRDLRPGLHALRIEPHEALAHYIRLQTGLGVLTDRILRAEVFHQLLEAAPGWRELITLGKIWHLEQQEDAAGEAAYDLVIVDAPATGHGLTFLDVPRVVQQAVSAGPLQRHAGWVEKLLRDRDRTLLLPVTLPEELPVSETVELVERVRTELDIGIDRIIVNRMPCRPAPKLLEATEALPPAFKIDRLPVRADLVELVRLASAVSRNADHERVRVSVACELPIVDLPTHAMSDGAAGPALPNHESLLVSPSWPGADPGDLT